MGCTSASRCTPEQQEELFSTAAKEMLTQCIGELATSPQALDAMVIPLPPEVEKVKQLAANIRTVSGIAKQKMADGGKGGVGAAGAAARASAQGGILEGAGSTAQAILGGAAQLFDKAAEAAAGLGGMAAEKALQFSADGLEQSIESLKETLSYAGRGWIFNKRDDVKKVFGGIIAQMKIQDAASLCRGAKPQGPAQFKACASDAITSYFFDGSRGKLLDDQTGLQPIALDVLARHKAQEDWDSLIWKYDQANKKLAEFEDSKGMVQEAIQLDINKYVVEQTVAQLRQLMGKEEAKRRENPKLGSSEGKEPPSSLFLICFSADLDGNMSLSKRLPADVYGKK